MTPEELAALRARVADDYGLLENWDESGEGYGLCPNCGAALRNWGAVSHGDGDMLDEIGCDVCEEVITEIHADYCECADCRATPLEVKEETE